MKKIFELLEVLIDRLPLAWQFFKFCLVGATNLSIYMAAYWALTRLLSWHYILASICGFAVAVTWSFYINLSWTFKHHGGGDRKRQYLKFLIANLISLGINLVLLTLFIEILRIYDIAAQLVTSVICAFFNFGINRFWTFRKR